MSSRSRPPTATGVDVAPIRVASSGTPLVLTPDSFAPETTTLLAIGYGGAIIIDASALAVPVELVGGPGNNVLTGGSADDLIVGGAASDVLSGGAGDDTLIANHGDDVLIGGTGSDYYVVIPGSSPSLTETSSTTDVNTIDFSQARTGLVFSLADNQGNPQRVDGRNTVAIHGNFRRLIGTPTPTPSPPTTWATRSSAAAAPARSSATRATTSSTRPTAPTPSTAAWATTPSWPARATSRPSAAAGPTA